MFFVDSLQKQNERMRLKKLIDEAKASKDSIDVIKHKVDQGNFSFLAIFANSLHAREELKLTKKEYEDLDFPTWLT